MDLETDDVLVYLDSWGIRRLFSLAVRRRGTGRKRQDPILEEFFQVLEKHWGKYTPKSKDKLAQKVQEMDSDQEVDAAELLSDSEISDCFQLHLLRAETDDYLEYSTPVKTPLAQDPLASVSCTTTEPESTPTPLKVLPEPQKYVR